MMKKLRSLTPLNALAKFLGRLKGDQKGNILIIMGFAVIPLTFATGFGIDYARAMNLQTQLNAAADAAALAAVAPSTILLPDSASQDAANKMFNAQAALLSGYQNLQMTPTITDGTSGSSGALGYLRKATVSYTVQSINLFGVVDAIVPFRTPGRRKQSLTFVIPNRLNRNFHLLSQITDF